MAEPWEQIAEERVQLIEKADAELRAAKYLIISHERQASIDRGNALADKWEESTLINEPNSNTVLIRKMVRDLRLALMIQ